MINDKIYPGMMVYSPPINRIGWLEEIIDLDHYLIRWNNNMTWLISKNNLINCHQHYLDLEKKNG